MFRRTNYFQYLDEYEELDSKRSWYYPLPEFGGVYSPNVQVFRGSEAKGYPFLDKPVELSFIAVPAYKRPKLEVETKGRKTGPTLYRLDAKTAEKTEKKIRAILSIGLVHNHDAIVLSGNSNCD